MCTDLASCEAYQRGRAAVEGNPAPDHIVAAVNRALRTSRGERGDPNDSDASARLVDVAR